jgi:hypothetical protein
MSKVSHFLSMAIGIAMQSSIKCKLLHHPGRQAQDWIHLAVASLMLASSQMDSYNPKKFNQSSGSQTWIRLSPATVIP